MINEKLINKDKILKVQQVYNATRRLQSDTGDVYNVIDVSPVNGTVLMYFITEAWPLEIWQLGSMVEIGQMLEQQNKIILKTTMSQNYRLKISALYIPD